MTFVLTFMTLGPLSATSVMAQSQTGELRGTVTDAGGGVVVEATVAVRNQATGVETNTRTTGEGIFVVPNLIPGRYTVTVESVGFKRSQVTDADVRLGQPTTIDVALQAGGVAETVTVVAATEEVINREQSQIASSFESRKVEELPSNAAGSGIDTLALLAPGVVVNSGSGTNTNGTGLSVNGNRGRSNNFQIDGSDNNDLSVGGPSLFVDNQDQIAEYQIITNNFSAQYGRNQGAIVNIITKSGTNDFHGSAFLFHRDRFNLDTLNNIERRAADPSNPESLNPPRFLSNVYGGTFGGPIKRNRAFFFGSYQGIKQRESAILRSGNVAILASEFPRLQAAFPNNNVINAIVTQSAFALTGLGTVRPRTDLGDPTSVTIGGRTFLRGGAFDTVTIGGQTFQAAQIERQVAFPFDQEEFSVRGDVKATDVDNFYIRFLYQKGNFQNSLASTNGFTGDIPFKTQNLGGTYTRQFGSNIVNEFRAVYQDIFVKFGGGCDPGPGCIPDPTEIGTAFTDITFSGAGARGDTSLAALRAIGGTGGFPQGRLIKTYQFADNVTWTRGRHSMMFGAEIKHLKSEVPFLPSFNGAFAFNSGARILSNAPSAFSLAIGEPIISYTEWDQYYFFQDDWKVRDNLTLNLGLRYEYTGQPINDLRDLTLARESGSNPLFNPNIDLESRVVPHIPADKNNFAPRIGFAYTPRFGKAFFGEDATVIRGGYSIAYDPAFYNILLNVSNAAPVSALLSLGTGQLPASNSPLPLPADTTGVTVRERAAAANLLPVGVLNPLLLTQVPVARDFHSPYSQQFSLGMQRQINRNNVAEVRYVGTRGIGLFQSVNRNPRFGSLFRGFTLTIPFENEDGELDVNFPAFPQFIPNGAVPVTCVNNPATADNEAACADRLLAGRGRITSRENTAQSTYHAMQTRFNGRALDNSLTYGVSYTWSKTIDNSSEIFAFAENSSVAQNPFDYNRGERSISNLDRPHAFAANFLYDVPFMKEQRGVAGHVLGGWQLNGTYILTSGRPYTPSQIFNSLFLGAGASYLGDTAGESLRPFVGNPNAAEGTVGISQIDAALIFGVPANNLNGFYSLNGLNNGEVNPVTPNDVRFIFNGPGAARFFGSPFGNSPRNALRGPAPNQLNLGIFKNTKVTENVRVQFRAELFNALNHPSPGFGVASGASIPDFFVEDAGFPGSEFASKNDMELNRRVVQFGLRITF
jgi:outer membrane receptor protein involved in Fe transport